VRLEGLRLSSSVIGQSATDALVYTPSIEICFKLSINRLGAILLKPRIEFLQLAL
jgi:hypothetical protein